MAWYAIFNGLGRIAWGTVSDKIGRQFAIALMMGLQGVVMLAMYHVFITFGLGHRLHHRRLLDRLQLWRQLRPVPGGDGRLLRQQERRAATTAMSSRPTAWRALPGRSWPGMYKDASSASAGPVIWMAPFLIAGAVCLLGALLATRARPPEAVPSVALSAADVSVGQAGLKAG